MTGLEKLIRATATEHANDPHLLHLLTSLNEQKANKTDFTAAALRSSTTAQEDATTTYLTKQEESSWRRKKSLPSNVQTERRPACAPASPARCC